MLDDLRYGVALLMVMTLPSAVGFWYVVHPFIGFWRRLGPVRTYTILFAAMLAAGVAGYLVRAPLLAVDLGTGPPLWAAAAASYAAAAVIEVRCRRHLRLPILFGMPELRTTGDGGKLLCEGIYGRVRHPRYVGVVFATLAMAFFSNYLASWVIAAFVPPALFGVVHFEERELRARFGQAYDEYASRVPRFLPRRAAG